MGILEEAHPEAPSDVESWHLGLCEILPGPEVDKTMVHIHEKQLPTLHT